jgi:hypothetical protein
LLGNSLASTLTPTSKAQYELQFKKWNFRKNRTAEEWKIVAHKITQRESEHKDSEVLVNGTPINPKKLRKETLRYRPRSGETEIPFPSSYLNLPFPILGLTMIIAELPPTPEGFIIRTPSPKLTTSIASTSLTSVSAPLWDVPPSINTSLIYCLPFYQVNSVLNQGMWGP